MTRKQKEAHVRRALAAGRCRHPMPEPGGTNLLHAESVDDAGSMDALNEAKDARVTGPRGA